MNEKDHYSGDDDSYDRITSIDELIEHIMDMINDSISTDNTKPAIRGFTIVNQPGKKPIAFGFRGHRRMEDSEPEEEREGDFYLFRQEPFIDICEIDNKIYLLADIGAEEEHVECYPYASHVELTVITPDMGYSRDINLPSAIRPESMVKNYRNGVLELAFELCDDAEQKP